MGQFEFFLLCHGSRKFKLTPLPGFARNYQLSGSDRPFALPHGRQAASPASRLATLAACGSPPSSSRILRRRARSSRSISTKFECHSLWPRTAHDGLGLDGAHALGQL